MAVAAGNRTIQQWSMLTRIYVEALLVDSVLADQVWELWDAGLISDELAAIAWWVSAFIESGRSTKGNWAITTVC